VTTRKLTTVDAFVVTDLDDAPLSAGIVRLAPKLLVDGASWLARSQTYLFASFERQVGGASAGINAAAEARAEAIAAFITEFTPDSAAVLLDAGKGLGAGEIAALRESDPRPAAAIDDAAALRRAGIVAAAELALGSLDGRTVAIEGFDAAGLELATDLVARGARIVALSTSAGTASSADGFDPGLLAEGFANHKADVVTELGVDAKPGWAVFGAAADALFVGSKTGALDHNGAPHVKAKVVVPAATLPVSAKALAMLTRSGVVVLPDFIVLGGSLAAWPSSGDARGDASVAAGELVTSALGEVLGAAQGPVLAACERAEAFLLTWRSELPFGRPIA
jgi:glutamate dehydrogenase (NAD(P)+)